MEGVQTQALHQEQPQDLLLQPRHYARRDAGVTSYDVSGRSTPIVWILSIHHDSLLGSVVLFYLDSYSPYDPCFDVLQNWGSSKHDG